jgi:hypothetical protein
LVNLQPCGQVDDNIFFIGNTNEHGYNKYIDTYIYLQLSEYCEGIGYAAAAGHGFLLMI